MINLLSPKEKRKRSQEKELKLIFIIAILVLALLGVMALSLLAVKFYIQNQVDFYKLLIKAKSDKTIHIQLLEDKVETVNTILLNFNNFYQSQFGVSDFLIQVEDLLLPGIKLESLSFQEEGLKVVMTGSAPSIERAYEFRAKLKEQPQLRQVDFSLPDWLQAEEVNFKVSFSLEK